MENQTGSQVIDEIDNQNLNNSAQAQAQAQPFKITDLSFANGLEQAKQLLAGPKGQAQGMQLKLTP